MKGYEPKLALYGGIDGLGIIEKIINKSKLILKNKGILAMEIGINQYHRVTKLLEKNGFFILKSIKDYQNIKRCLIAKKLNK